MIGSPPERIGAAVPIASGERAAATPRLIGDLADVLRPSKGHGRGGMSYADRDRSLLVVSGSEGELD